MPEGVELGVSDTAGTEMTVPMPVATMATSTDDPTRLFGAWVDMHYHLAPFPLPRGHARQCRAISPAET